MYNIALHNEHISEYPKIICIQFLLNKSQLLFYLEIKRLLNRKWNFNKLKFNVFENILYTNKICKQEFLLWKTFHQSNWKNLTILVGTNNFNILRINKLQCWQWELTNIIFFQFFCFLLNNDQYGLVNFLPYEAV